jgi:hypothetical protein
VNGTDAPLVVSTLPVACEPERRCAVTPVVHVPVVEVPAMIDVNAVVPAVVMPPAVTLHVPVRAVFALPEFVRLRVHTIAAGPAACVQETTLAWT